MDNIIEAIIEVAGSVFEFIFDHIKNPQKRRWALTGLYSVIATVMDGFLLWRMISFLQDENHLGAAVLGGFTVLATVIFGFIIIRGHRRNWQSVKKPSP